MKLLFIIDNGKIIGGGDYAQFKFAEHLARLGHDITIFAKNKNKFLDDLAQLKNMKIHFSGEIPNIVKGIGIINRIWLKIYLFLFIKPFIRKNKDIDFIIGYLRDPAITVVELGKFFCLRTVNFIFENPEWMERQLGPRFGKEYHGRFKNSWIKAKEAYLASDILIPNSDLTRKECSIWLNKPVETPVYPGVDVAVSDISVKEENQVIYVGRLNEYKNINEVIEALSGIKNPPRLVLVGTGEEENRLRKLANDLHVDCDFKGSLDDRSKWIEIRKSKFMIFASSFEGFGMPPAEALIYRKPCICSDLPIFREVYKDYLEYYKEHDIKSMRSKIELLLKKPDYCKKRGEKGRAYIINNYSWQKSAKKIESILVKFKK